MTNAMISHLGDGDWEETTLESAQSLVSEGKAYRCQLCDDTEQDIPYDDGLPSFHYTEVEA